MKKDSKIKEINKLSDIFNGMIMQIKKLKIHQKLTHTKKISEQKIRLQYLSLQIKPHFFLNCLTNFYALVEQRKYSNLKDSIITVSEYLRYVFRDNFKPVILQEELKFTRNYIELRKNSYKNKIIVLEDIKQNVLQEVVPSLVIETFVENSLKYAESDEDLIVI